MTSYEKKILRAWKAISRMNGGKGASAHEVTMHMANSGMLAPLDTVIDIADQMKVMAERGDLR